VRIEGLEAHESDALIEELTGCMIQPDGEYRHRWRKGDIVIWDNRCSYHRAAGDYPPEEDRIHWRVSIKERPGPSSGTSSPTPTTASATPTTTASSRTMPISPGRS